MTSDSTGAIIGVCITGAISLIAAAFAAWTQWKLSLSIQSLQSKQDTDRAKHERQLVILQQRLVNEHDRQVQATEAEKLVAKYRDPLLRSAYDLQSRIYNIYKGGFVGRSEPEYFRTNTLFVLAEFLGWLEIIRREMQFLDLGLEKPTGDLRIQLELIQDLLASHGFSENDDDNLHVYRGHQRAIGEVMIDRHAGNVVGHRQLECIGYATFVASLARIEFSKWFDRLGDAIAPLQTSTALAGKSTRLAYVQNALIALIDLLDHDCRYFPDQDKRKLIVMPGDR